MLLAAVLLGPALAVAPEPASPKAGDAWIRPADGMEMVYVPAGEFLMGSTEAERDGYLARCLADGFEESWCWEWLGDETPQHTVYLDAFWIDKTEVTNAQYQACVEAGVCWLSRCGDDPNVNAPDQPAVCMSWEGAQAYADWVGARLPTEAEWEKAARGTEGRTYPWGDVFDPDKLNFCDKDCPRDWRDSNRDDGHAWTAPVGSYRAGASPYGALDMAGNAWEWVADWYDRDYYARSAARNPQGPESGLDRGLRGGSYSNVPWSVRCAYRFRSYETDVIGYYGFRLVLPAIPSEGGSEPNQTSAY
jgi:formylglycine-generating enzyme required for sulfatase activity